MYKAFALFSLGFLSFFSFFVPSVSAATDCDVVYGGGEINCEATPSAAVKMSPTPTRVPVQKPAASSGQNTTKGGLPVYEPTKATETPSTGPEAFGLITLLPAAAAGIWLRRKTK